MLAYEEERQLRELVSQGLGITQISQVLDKPSLCVKGKVYNLGLSVVVAAGSRHTVAATAAATSPAPVTDAALKQQLAFSAFIRNVENGVLELLDFFLPFWSTAMLAIPLRRWQSNCNVKLAELKYT